MDTDFAISKSLAPEDISPGAYIAVLHITQEYLDIFSECRLGPPQPFRVTWLAPQPVAYKVQSVCLPFVLVEDANGVSAILDTRRCSLCLLNEDFARRAMKKVRKAKAE